MENNSTQGIIISIGSVNADFQVRVDQEAGSTTTMLAHHFVRLSGGKAANVAFLARRLDAPATLIARVGKDDLQEQALRPLQEKGVDISNVRKVEGASTGVSMIAVPPNGKKFIMLASNANDLWEKEDGDLVRQLIEKAPSGSVLVIDYEISAFIVEVAINAAAERGFSVILDPSPTNRVNKSLYPKIDYLVPDASETEQLTGILPDSIEKAVKAARLLVQNGIRTAMVKLDEGGCVVVSSGTTLHVPPVPVEVTDTTGAGDAFAGALAVAVLEKQSLSDSACYATAASLATVSAYGSQPAYPSRDRLQSLFKQVSANINILDGQ